jgi:hypothetical protein
MKVELLNTQNAYLSGAQVIKRRGPNCSKTNHDDIESWHLHNSRDNKARRPSICGMRPVKFAHT